MVDPRLDPDRFWPRLRRVLTDVPVEERTPPPSARAGAVLVLLEDTDDGPRVVLTRRRRDMRSHPGQVSFPGGRIDPGETVEQAAVREAAEEVGLRPDSVEVLGAGPRFYIPPSRFWVVPVVARWRAPHRLSENPWEVDEILRVPLTTLTEPARWRGVGLSAFGVSWAWQLDEDLLWGATARVLATMLDVSVEDWHGGTRPDDLDPARLVRPWEDAPVRPRPTRLVGDLPARSQDEVPHVTAAQVRLARRWMDERGVGLTARAEHAGRAAAHAVRRLVDDGLEGLAVTVLAGPSSNGAAGLAAARLLHSAGADVDVLTVGPPRVARQVELLHAAGVEVRAVGEAGLGEHSPGEVVVDAVLGIGAEPPLEDLAATAAAWLERHDVRIVALDLPSGLSADRGLRGACVAVDVTLAMGLPTVSLRSQIAQAFTGDLYVADLGIPRAAWRAAEVDVPADLFARGPLVRLTEGGIHQSDGPADPA
jgi:hydroxyethylthiazole kinase-like uncharacterized protein yjeF